MISTAHQRYRDQSFFGSLNGLRFLCIFAVMWHHSPASVHLRGTVALLDRGFTGVDFFFVLSGFLITTLLLREEARKGRFSLRGFYWRRILRIVPVYFLVVTLVAGYYILVQGRTDYVALLPYYYLFFSNMLVEDIPLLTITWSLAVEEQYYLMWPLLLLLLPAVVRVRGLVLVVLIGVCALSAQGLLQGTGLRPIVAEHAIWRLPATGYQAILIGSLAAVVLHSPRGFGVLYRLLGAAWTPLAGFALLLVMLQILPGVLLGWPNLVLHLTMAACLISIVIREDHMAARALSWRPIVRIGEISYGLYLYHLIGLHFGATAAAGLGLTGLAQVWMGTLLFVPVSIMMAEMSFRTFESYFLRLRHRRPRTAPS